MIIKSKKGFTLIEVVMALAIVCFATVAVTSLMVYGSDSFNSETNYTRQQEKIHRTFERIGKEVEEAQNIEFDSVTEELRLTFPGTTPSTRTWRFNGNALQLRTDGGTSFQTVVDDLQVGHIRYIPSLRRVVISARPRETNIGRFQGKNIRQTKVIEFSIDYKL